MESCSGPGSIRLGDTRAVEALIKALSDVKETVDYAAITALGEIGTKAVDPLIVELENEHSRVRSNAASALGIIGDPKANKALTKLLKDDNSYVRTVAKNALKNIKAIQKLSESTKFRQKMKEINQWLKGIRNRVKLKVWWPLLEQKLVGHYQYYGISGNIKGLQSYYHHTVKLAFKWLNRRSQKKSYEDFD